MKVDSTRWCSPEHKSGKYLADTLEKIGDERLVKKVNTYFNRFQSRMKPLNCLDKNLRVFYLDLLLKKTEKEIIYNFSKFGHELVVTLMLNLIKSFYRMELIKIS